MKLHGKLSLLVLLIIAGCGGSGGGMPPTANEGTGQFIDSAVEGLEYQSGSIRGLTSSDGSFQYEQGSSVRFFIGDIVLGEGTPADVMSPLDIVAGSPGVTDDHVLNVARFLQTLDTDNNPSNGITITPLARMQAVGEINFAVSSAKFEIDSSVLRIVAVMTEGNVGGSQSLVSIADAEAHLRESLGMEPMPKPALTLAELREVCWEPTTTELTGDYKEGEVEVKFDPSISPDEVTTLMTSYNLSWDGAFYLMFSDGSWGSVSVPVGRELDWINTFETLCVVQYAEVTHRVSIPFYPGTGDCSLAC